MDNKKNSNMLLMTHKGSTAAAVAVAAADVFADADADAVADAVAAGFGRGLDYCGRAPVGKTVMRL